MDIIVSFFESIIDGVIDWIVNRCVKGFKNRRKNNGSYKNAQRVLPIWQELTAEIPMKLSSGSNTISERA